MGFIFFPLLMISTLSLVAVNFMSVFSFDWYVSLPVLELNFWLKFALHAFLPFYLLVTLNQSDDENEKGVPHG